MQLVSYDSFVLLFLSFIFQAFWQQVYFNTRGVYHLYVCAPRARTHYTIRTGRAMVSIPSILPLTELSQNFRPGTELQLPSVKEVPKNEFIIFSTFCVCKVWATASKAYWPLCGQIYNLSRNQVKCTRRFPHFSLLEKVGGSDSPNGNWQSAKLLHFEPWGPAALIPLLIGYKMSVCQLWVN